MVSFLIVKNTGVISTGDYNKPKDRLFDLTENVNKFINNNIPTTKWIQIIAWLNLDANFIAVMLVFIFKSQSLRTPTSIGIFYIIRALLQLLQTSPFPEGTYWEDPGFPTLINIYGRQSDFFFSGHIGFLVLCTIEYFSCKCYKLAIYGIFTSVCFFILLIWFRVHYTIDLFTGIFFSHYVYYITGKFIHLVDTRLLQPKADVVGDQQNEALNRPQKTTCEE